MKNSIFRSILIGVLTGLLFFVAFRLVLVVLILAAIFKLSGVGKWKRAHWREQRLVYIESVRNMNDDEFQRFKSDYNNGYCRPHHYNH